MTELVESDPNGVFLHEVRRIREEMGGLDRIEALHRVGKPTARERIDSLVDPGSFREIGTFAHSEQPGDANTTPGDGKLVGRAKLDGRPITVLVDDFTVKRASTSIVNARKVRRAEELAERDGVPIIMFGETAGARIPDIMGSAGFAAQSAGRKSRQGRRVPSVTVITGDSFGGSSFHAASSDLTVQMRGTCLAITAPRVLEMATGETPTMEELGGVEVHGRVTGQIGLAAEDAAEANALVRRFLSFLPSNAWTPPPRALSAEPEVSDVAGRLPGNRRRAYDMRGVVRGIVDAGSMFELMPLFGRSVLTILARIDGRPVGVIASQPMQQAGVLGPDACDKATRLVCLCDAFGLPLVFLHDTPGFMVGTGVEHSRLLYKATMLLQAIGFAAVPKLAVVVRKSYGVAHYAMCGIGMDNDLLCAWPSAEISFMEPETAANVLKPKVASDDPEDRRAFAAEIAAEITPYGAAGSMRIDEIIHPNSTRHVLASALEDFSTRPFQPGNDRPLATWPTAW